MNIENIFINKDCTLTQNQIKTIFNPIIKIGEKVGVNIFDIEVEDNDTTYIYLEKKASDKKYWDKETIKFLEELRNTNYSMLLADEYYGEDVDVLILYDIKEVLK